MILAIDGSTNWCCIAVTAKGNVLAEKGWLTIRGHTVDLSAEIAATLHQLKATADQLKAVVVATGPGSFSGLRASMAVAKGIAFARRIPIVGVPTMDAMAALAYPSHHAVWCIIQLGRGRAAVARYRTDTLPPQRLEPYTIFVRSKGYPPIAEQERVLGDWDTLVQRGETIELPSKAAWWKIRHCAALACLGELRLQTHGPDDLVSLEPIYVSGPPAPGSAQF